jgi:hypothetical protein
VIISAAESANLIITPEHLMAANDMLTDLEADMPKVFNQIGQDDKTIHVDKILTYVRKRGRAPYEDVYRFVHAHFPSFRDFEDVLSGLFKSGYLVLVKDGDKIFIEPGIVTE